MPVDPKFPRERIEDIFADAGVRAVITKPALATGFTFGAATSVLMVDRDIDEIEAQPREPLAHRRQRAPPRRRLLRHLHVGLHRPAERRDDRPPQRRGVRQDAAPRYTR